MTKRGLQKFALILGLAFALVGGAAFAFSRSMLAQTPSESEVQEKTRTRKVSELPSPSPSPTKEDVPMESDEVVRVETNLTNIFFTAADRNKRFISDLKKENIRVLEDGQPQEIFTFQQNIDLPLSVAILLDTSISEQRTLPDEKAAAQSFLEAVMRPQKDEAAVLSFTGDVTLEQGFTGNMDRLRRAIDHVEFVAPSGYVGGNVVVQSGSTQPTPPISDVNRDLAGSTAIWDAVWVCANDLMADSADNTRRAMILLTDGMDTSSRLKMHEAIERAQKAEVLIYAIGIGDSYEGGVEMGALRKVAELTGGRAYFPQSETELRSAFAQIQRDLREQYLLAYSPSNKARDGSYRKIQIEVVDPELRKQNLKLTYRPGYFARTADRGTPPRKRP
ncbi:MAG: VWA domain-containing protein [Pyrinomonadaceae bacterium]|nr:VWA domain-containing protein [Pyrinomonadaceae bacterium]